MTGPVATLPNALTLLRGLAALPIAIAIANSRFDVALALVFLAGVTDGLDGLLARRTGQTSDVGRLLDPIADKLLLVTIFVVASLPGLGFEPLPWWLVTLAVLRDVGLVVVAFAIYVLTGFSGFTPTFLGKLNTVVELVLIGLFLVTHALGLPAWPLRLGIYLTAASILVSGIHYVFHVRGQLAGTTGGVGARVS